MVVALREHMLAPDNVHPVGHTIKFVGCGQQYLWVLTAQSHATSEQLLSGTVIEMALAAPFNPSVAIIAIGITSGFIFLFPFVIWLNKNHQIHWWSGS